MNDEQLIEAMMKAYYTPDERGEFVGMRAALAVVREQWGRDAERLRYVVANGFGDGYAGIPLDRYDYAMQCATEAGRKEPNDDDELNGARRLIDAARAQEKQ